MASVSANGLRAARHIEILKRSLYLRAAFAEALVHCANVHDFADGSQ